MYEPNEAKVLARIGPDDVVLDVGGGARRFNRANYVLDCDPYETRGKLYQEKMQLGPQGGPVEHFTAETWIVCDICDRTPWPFADKSIDYCICSHTLEDIRDPLWVCSEMRRVARRGYIEVPSRVFEASRNREPGVPVGLCHHRWHCETSATNIAFFSKMHFIHGDPRCSIPEPCWRSLPQDLMFNWLFWEDTFTCFEGYLAPDDLRAFAAQFAPAVEEPTERDRLEAEVQALRQELEATQAQLAELQELGPASIAVARRLRNLSRRHPRISSTLRRVLRPAS